MQALQILSDVQWLKVLFIAFSASTIILVLAVL